MAQRPVVALEEEKISVELSIKSVHLCQCLNLRSCLPLLPLLSQGERGALCAAVVLSVLELQSSPPWPPAALQRREERVALVTTSRASLLD